MRYLPLNTNDRNAMLAQIGADSIDDLFVDVPRDAWRNADFDLPNHAGELAVERHMTALAGKNLSAGAAPFFCGAGAYRHHVPATVDHMIQRGEFLTAYTPYQPEISQGTLQCLFEFQSQVARLVGMEVANASMYDGSTACAEAVLMARRVGRKKTRAVLAGSLHGQYTDVVKTQTRFTDDEIVTLPANVSDPAAEVAALIDAIDENTASVVVQSPNAFGHLIDLEPIAEAAHASGALLIAVVTEVVSLGAIKSPGEMGADIVVGEGQSIGNGLGFGGPYLGLFATRQKFVRHMPGRVCGETVDATGKRGFVLTLSTREQHIRREKATSNICTNSGLCALAFTIHMTLLGEAGLRKLATLNHAAAVKCRDKLTAAGIEVINDTFFNEFSVRLNRSAADAVDALAEQGILAGVPASRLYPENENLANILLVAVTETTTDEDMDRLTSALQGYAS